MAEKKKLVRTEFMAAFTKQFIGRTATNPFPAIGQSNADIAANFNTIMSILIAAEVGRKPPRTGNGRSLAGKVRNFLIAQKWPASTPLPKQLQDIQPTVRLIEIAVIADRLLQEINLIPGRGRPKSDGPGPAPGWPPH
jgi:hypothetical protein